MHPAEPSTLPSADRHHGYRMQRAKRAIRSKPLGFRKNFRDAGFGLARPVQDTGKSRPAGIACLTGG
jgi:hypothetical protein